MLFGGNWNNGANSGSRNVNTNTATNSNTNNGARGLSDDSWLYCCHDAIGRPYYGQLKCPATANTLRGSVKRRVPLRREMRDRQNHG